MQSRPKDSTEIRKKKNEALSMMITLIDTYLDRLPAYMFLSAFSQLVSRICHPVREVSMLFITGCIFFDGVLGIFATKTYHF